MKKKMTLADKGALNIASTVIGMMIPIIIYPYLLRSLGVESYGKISFAQTVSTYFVILGTLGINNYAQRECSAVKNNYMLFSRKVTEVFLMNAALTVISIFAYLIAVFSVPVFRDEIPLYIIFGFFIFGTCMKMDWLYAATERFDITSIRNIVTKIVYIVPCFLFVHTKKDYCVYAIIITVSYAFVPMLWNYYGLFVKKDNVRFCYVKDVNLRHGIKPIIYLSLLTIGSKLFSSLDVVMIQAMLGDKSVGLYSAATKLPLVIDELLMAGAAVVTPRMFVAVQNRDEVGTKKIVGLTSNALFFIAVPAILTCLFFSKELLYLFAGKDYLEASNCLKVYSGIMMTSLIITLAGTRMYVARKKEQKLFVILVVFSLINGILNYFLMKECGVFGAALATLIANILLMVVELTLEKSWHYVFEVSKLKYIIGSVGVIIVFFIVKAFGQSNPAITLSEAIGIGGIIYLTILILVKESTVITVLKRVQRICFRGKQNGC